VAEQILNLNKETGLNHLILSMQWSGMPQSMVLDTITMVAEEVFPRVRNG